MFYIFFYCLWSLYFRTLKQILAHKKSRRMKIYNFSCLLVLRYSKKIWIHRIKNRTSYSCGCKTIPGIIFLGSRSGKSFPSGSAIVAICISEDKNRKIRDFAKTSPMQLLFPNPNDANLKWINWKITLPFQSITTPILLGKQNFSNSWVHVTHFV